MPSSSVLSFQSSAKSLPAWYWVYCSLHPNVMMHHLLPGILGLTSTSIQFQPIKNFILKTMPWEVYCYLIILNNNLPVILDVSTLPAQWPLFNITTLSQFVSYHRWLNYTVLPSTWCVIFPFIPTPSTFEVNITSTVFQMVNWISDF